MAVRRFKATKDNTITNAYKANLTTRGTGSNMGASDIVEVFSIYAQQTTSSSELSRILIDFDIETLSASRDSGDIPESGSVDFYLRLYNAEHSSTNPTNFYLTVAAISQSWNEGIVWIWKTTKIKTFQVQTGFILVSTRSGLTMRMWF